MISDPLLGKHSDRMGEAGRVDLDTTLSSVSEGCSQRVSTSTVLATSTEGGTDNGGLGRTGAQTFPGGQHRTPIEGPLCLESLCLVSDFILQVRHDWADSFLPAVSFPTGRAHPTGRKRKRILGDYPTAWAPCALKVRHASNKISQMLSANKKSSIQCWAREEAGLTEKSRVFVCGTSPTDRDKYFHNFPSPGLISAL